MASAFREGDLVAGKYRVDRMLGEGGMGVVFAATHVDLDQRVAIKVLQPEAAARPDVVARFAREARAAARIRGTHVARVLDTGRLDDGAPFMVMEYLEGEDLAQLVDRKGKLSPREAVTFLLQACEALAEAHAAGIVHRDLKPSNLFLARQPNGRRIVKVLDFGISKMAEEGAALTRTATAMGSPHYMSPEQLTDAKDVDVRTDIWSLGVTLYELLTASRPFEAETMPQIVAQILQNAPDRVTSRAPEVPSELDLVVLRCMRSQPDSRFEDVAELARALEPFADPADQVGAAAVSRALTGLSDPPPAERRERPSGAPTMAGGKGAAPVSARIAVQTSARPGAPTQEVPAVAAVTASAVLPTASSMSVDAGAGAGAEEGRVAREPTSRMRLAVSAVVGVALLGTVVLFAARSRSAAPPSTPTTAVTPTSTATASTPAASAVAAAPTTTPALPPVETAAAPAAASARPTAAGSGRKVTTKPPVTAPAAVSAAPAVHVTPAPAVSNPLQMGIK